MASATSPLGIRVQLRLMLRPVSCGSVQVTIPRASNIHESWPGIDLARVFRHKAANLSASAARVDAGYYEQSVDLSGSITAVNTQNLYQFELACHIIAPVQRNRNQASHSKHLLEDAKPAIALQQLHLPLAKALQKE